MADRFDLRRFIGERSKRQHPIESPPSKSNRKRFNATNETCRRDHISSRQIVENDGYPASY